MPDSSDPPIREFADRGTLWLLEAPENLRDLLRLVAADLAERLDFSRAERINRSFVPDDLHKQEADLLYHVPFRDGRGEVWVYVLLEHQSKPDRTMGLRLLSYMVQIWETQVRAWKDAGVPVSRWRLHPVLPVVFYTGRRKWKSSIRLSALMETPKALETFVPTWETLFLNLHETPAAALTGSAVTAVLRALQASEEPTETLAEVLSEVTGYLASLPESEQGLWRRAMQFLYLLVLHTREAREHALLAEILDEAVEGKQDQEVREMAKTMAQELEARGRKEGREEGQREALAAVLADKFGLSSEEAMKKVIAVPSWRLSQLILLAARATTLNELGL